MDIETCVKNRFTTKVFDPSRKIEPALIEKIETLLRFSPSSTNAQPWHFFIAASDAGKQQIAKATSGVYSFNEEKVLNASHVIVLCARANIDELYLRKVLDQEDKDRRFADEKARETQHKGRSFFVNRHRFELRDAPHWMEKQVYLALGFLLLGAASLGIDACPIEGFDQVILDAELGLREKGLVSSLIVPLGYHAAEDFNAKLPKSRLSVESVITRL